ncbi:DNA-binding protein kinase TEL1 SCDLUD_000147 [Saccharomycodes ludwigii]|uniref:DNA-binding protein kinase TEL1 n=1 Tax=Saccharomycodes ludwigii TaxID=36035 RepID=UPI001E88DAB4|nr:hypothetical protein SCDLUD_000147 [Saccharomycodes ludwigii]KAH3902567.1 hypothetical protein SCDLUD_000147 [Saccharomycodes ludwigii]
MSTWNAELILEKLNSSRLRERNEGYEDLLSCLKNNTISIPTKLLYSFLDVLIRHLELDRVKYFKELNKENNENFRALNNIENKLQSSSYILRIFIEKNCERFKAKHLKYVLAMLPELMNHAESQKTLKSTEPNLVIALYSLVKSTVFGIKYSVHQWTELIFYVCRIIENKAVNYDSEKEYANWLLIFNELLSEECISVRQSASDYILHCMSEYTKYTRKEKITSMLPIQLVNKALLRIHCNFFECMDIVNWTLERICNSNNANEGLFDVEISYFGLFAGELMLPLTQHRVCQSIDILELYLQNRINNVSSVRDFDLEFCLLEEYDGPIISWLMLPDFQLKPGNEIHLENWLEINSLTSLIYCYYTHVDISDDDSDAERPVLIGEGGNGGEEEKEKEKEKEKENENENENEKESNILFSNKKSKIGNNYNQVLNSCSTFNDFLFSLLDCSTETNKVILGLQITAFFLSQYRQERQNFNFDRLLGVLLSLLGRAEFYKWCCLSLISLISQPAYKMDIMHFEDLMKALLPYVKSSSFSTITCALIYRLELFQHNLIKGKTLLNRIYDIIDLSVVNGPAQFNRESFLFWQTIFKLGKNYRSPNNESLLSKICRWVLFKWSQLTDTFVENNSTGLAFFFRWISKKDELHEKRTLQYDYFNTIYYDQWVFVNNERDFLYQNKHKFKKISLNAKDTMQMHFEINLTYDLFSKLLDLLANLEHVEFETAVKWLAEILKILTYFVGDSTVSAYTADLKSMLVIYLGNLHIENYQQAILLIRELNLINLKMVPEIILQEISKKKLPDIILSHYTNTETQKSVIDQEFDSVDMKLNRKQPVLRYKTFSEYQYRSCDLDHTLNFIFNTHITHELYPFVIDYVTEYISFFPNECYIWFLKIILRELNNKHAVTNVASLSKLTQLYGSSLLNTKLNTSNISIECLSLYLRAVSNLWINQLGSSIQSDCNDIFDWISEKCVNNDFGGSAALFSFTNLLIDILKEPSVSKAVKGGKQRVFNILVQNWKKLPLYYMSKTAKSVSEYMLTKSKPNQAILFPQLVNALDITDGTGCSSNLIIYILCKFATFSKFNLINSVLYMATSGTRYGINPIFIKVGYRFLKKAYGFDHVREIFQFCKYQLVEAWYLESSAFENINEIEWHFKDFGFKTLEEFLISNQNEFYALYYSKTIKSSLIRNLILKYSGKNENELYENSLALVLPFSYNDYGLEKNSLSAIKNTLGTKYKRNIEKYKHAYLYEIFKFVALGDFFEIKTILKKSFTNSSLKAVLFEFGVTLRYHFPGEISIIKVYELLENSSLLFIFTRKDIYLLMLWLFADLENSSQPEDRLYDIRKIKILMILFETHLPNNEFIGNIIFKMVPYLKDIFLHEEVSCIIVAILQIVPISVLEKEGRISALLESILYYQRSFNKLINDKLRVTLNTCLTSNTSFQATWEMALQIINGELFLNDPYSNNDLLNQKYVTSYDIQFFSELFRHLKPPVMFDEHFKTLENITDNLLKFNVKDVSMNFSLWKSYYLTQSYKYSKVIPNLSFETNSILMDVTKYESFTPILDIIFAKTTKIDLSAKVHFISISIIAFLLGRYSEEDPYLKITESCFEKYYDLIDPIDSTVFCKLHKVVPTTIPLSSFIFNQYKNITTDYATWLKQLWFSLAYEVSSVIKLIPYLTVLAEHDLSFIKESIPYLFLFYINVDRKQRCANIGCMFESCTGLSGVIDGKMKICNMLDLFLLLRCGNYTFIKPFMDIYSKLNLKECFFAAMEVGNYKLSFILFEEMFQDFKKCDINIDTIKSMYRSLKDRDLLFGIPSKPSIKSVLELMDSSDKDKIKKFMFANSITDINYNNDEEEAKHRLLKTASENDLSSISTMIIDQNREIFGNDSAWYKTLNTWELNNDAKMSKEPLSALFQCLKKIKESVHDYKDIIGDLLFNIEKNSMLQTKEYFNLIYELVDFQNFTFDSKHFEKYTQLMKDMNNRDTQMMNIIDFDRYKLILNARTKLLGEISESCKNDRNFELVKLTEFIELVKLNKFSQKTGISQEGLKSAFMLDKMASGDVSLLPSGLISIDNILKRVAQIRVASTLWDQGESQIPIQMLEGCLFSQTNGYKSDKTIRKLMDLIYCSNGKVMSLLVSWASETNHKTAGEIYEQYVLKAPELSLSSEILEVYYTLGQFCYEQTKESSKSNELDQRKKSHEKNMKELDELAGIYKSADALDVDRKEAKRYYNRLFLQGEQDKRIIKTLESEKQLFISKTLHFFLKTIIYDNAKDYDVLDKFCGVWFGNSENVEINKNLLEEISSIPSFKFLPWINQMVAKLDLESTHFQVALQKTLKRVIFKLPYESMYALINLKFYNGHGGSDNGTNVTHLDDSINCKIMAANNILQNLEHFEDGKFGQKYIQPVKYFSTMCVELANMKFARTVKNIDLNSMKIGHFWLDELINFKFPLPTVQFPILSSSDGRSVRRPYIVKVENKVEISQSGLSMPKIMTFTLSDGTVHKVLLKGSNDDLRQDAIMEQVFKQVNQILNKNKETSKHHLRMKTYEVIPLGPQAGIIEFVSNSKSLHEILIKLHMDDKMSFDKARRTMKAAQNKSQHERLIVYEKIETMITPKFRQYFFANYMDPEKWLEIKYRYIKSVVTTSIVGFIVGLGDRHLNNILVNKDTGEFLHIDLGVAFDQGRLLPIPELVPFRLTRDIVDAFGVSGIEGVFRKNCEYVYSVLRKESEKVMCVLNILKWDPLYSWTMSPLKKKKLQTNIMDDEDVDEMEKEAGSTMGGSRSQSTKDNNNINATGPNKNKSKENGEAVRALKCVEEKLNGNGLSVEATVQGLIQQATDPSRLSVIYMGWSPFY